MLAPNISSPYVGSLLWSAIVLLSFVGWGRLVHRRWFSEQRVDTGLAAAWGMALLLSMGGVLMALGLATRPALAALVVMGALVGVADTVRTSKSTVRDVIPRHLEEWGFLMGVVVVVGLAVIQLAASPLHPGYYWQCDDAPAYVVFPTETLQTGTFVQPFSLRAMTSFGGQVLLNAFFLIRMPAHALQVVDRGASLLMILALVFGYPMARRAKPWLLVPAVVLVTLPDIRANTTSMLSGAVLLLGTARTLQIDGLRGPKAAALFAMLTVGTMVLRHNYVIPAVVMLVVGCTLPLVRSKALERRDMVLEALTAFGCVLVLFVPWAWVSYRSNGTFLYPLINGNFHPEYGAIGQSIDLSSRLETLWINATYDGPIKTLPLFVLAGLFVRDGSRRRAIVALLVGSVVGFVTLISTFQWADPGDSARYTFGFEVASVAAISLACLASAARNDTAARTLHVPSIGNVSLLTLGPAVIVLCASILQLHDTRAIVAASYRTSLELIAANRSSATKPADPLDETYRALQESIPAGAPLFTFLDDPYRLNFRRNKILIGDLPVVVSPPPGLPVDSDEAFSRYLASMSIRYFAYVDPKSSKELYSSAVWRELANSPSAIHKSLTPIFFRVFALIERCRRTRQVVFERDGMVVLDLATPAKS